MENKDINGNEIDMKAYCPMMPSKMCLLCMQKRSIFYEYDDNMNFTIVPAEEIED
jgi:hypothetical protein